MIERLRGIPSSQINRYEAMFWLGFGIPYLLWWRDLVVVIGIMSLYANIRTAFATYKEARAKEMMESRP